GSDTPITSRTYNVNVTDGDGASTGNVPITVNITPQNDPPAINNAPNEAAYTELAPPVQLSAPFGDPNALFVTDPDVVEGPQPDILSGSVTISNGFLAGDQLAADTTGTAIGVGYDPNTGVLSLSGLDTLANYSKVLDSVTFSSTSHDPTNGGLDPTRTVSWTVTDNGSPHPSSAPPTPPNDLTPLDTAPPPAAPAPPAGAPRAPRAGQTT